MGKVKVSRKLRMAAKTSNLRHWQHAQNVRLHPSAFSRLVTGAELVSPGDERVVAIARELGFSIDEAFEEVERPATGCKSEHADRRSLAHYN
jgi:hypothetical protein